MKNNTSTLTRRSLVSAVSVICTAMGAGGAFAQAESTNTGPAKATTSLIENVIVSARRREETAQEVPISMAAISADTMEAHAVKELRDLTTIVPGVNFTGTATPVNTLFIIRGLGRGTTGNSQSAVVTYFNDVPLPNFASNAPTFDLASVEVLKGSQGTLFGRNTLSGAVLVRSATPEYVTSARLSAIAGDYKWRQYDIMVNTPIVDDVVALRVAGQISRRDGYTKNMSFPGHDLDDIHRDNLRVSLLLDPTDKLSNTTVFEYDNADEAGVGNVYYQTLAPIFPFDLIGAQQKAAGPRKAFNDIRPSFTADIYTLTNTTSFDLSDNLKLKNIIGYRDVKWEAIIDADGIGNTDIGGGIVLPGFVNIYRKEHNRQFSEELQLSGTALDDKLEYIAGLFYVKAEPVGDGGNLLDLGLLGAQYGANQYLKDESKAVFGQVTYELTSDISIDAGIRYTKDKQSVCSRGYLGLVGYENTTSPDDCFDNDDGQSNKPSASSDAATYNLGLNYKPTGDILLYGVVRKGYRAGGTNVPLLQDALVPYRNYKPEYIQDFELGLKTSWAIGDVTGRFNLSGYISKDTDLQAAVATTSLVDPDGNANPLDDPAEGVFIANVGKATLKGIETEIGVQPIRNLDISVAAFRAKQEVDSIDLSLPSFYPPSLISAEGIQSLAFFGAPEWGVTVSALYTLPLPAAIGEMSLQGQFFRGSSVQYVTIITPITEKADFRLSWNRIMGSSFDAAAFVTNAFDHLNVSGPSASTQGLPFNSVSYGEPRIAGVQVSYSFGK